MKIQHEYVEQGAVCATLFAISIALTRLAIKIARTPNNQEAP